MHKLIFAATLFYTCALCAAPVTLLEPAAGATVPTLTDAQKAYVSMPLEERRAKFADKEFRAKEMGLPAEIVGGKARKASWPRSTRLAWKDATAREYAVKVVEAATGAFVFETVTKTNAVHVDNLKVATEYKWTVTADGESAATSFKTEAVPPRLIRFPGVPNMRDIGGYIGLDGRRVKQGLIYRSASFNDHPHQEFYTKKELFDAGRGAEWEAAQSNKVKKVRKSISLGKTRFSDKSRDAMQKVLGIKTDIDIRNKWECSCMTNSPLGTAVQWHHLPFAAYGGIHSAAARRTFRKIFRILLDENNYPVDFHCYAGQDRTGTLSYILLALLGVSDNDLSLDWEATGFFNRGVNFAHKGFYDQIGKGFKKHCDAETTILRAEKYVKGLGFTDEDIASFRAIMLEP